MRRVVIGRGQLQRVRQMARHRVHVVLGKADVRQPGGTERLQVTQARRGTQRVRPQHLVAPGRHPTVVVLDPGLDHADPRRDRRSGLQGELAAQGAAQRTGDVTGTLR